MRSSATLVTGDRHAPNVGPRQPHSRHFKIQAENLKFLHHSAPELMRMTKSGTKPTQCTLDVWTSKLGKKRKKSDRDEDVGSF